MRKILGIIALAAAALGIAACEQTDTSVEKAPIVIYDGLPDLADKGFGMYYGDRNFNSEGVYSVVLSDAVCFRDGYGEPYLDSEGDMLVLEFHAPLQDDDEPVMIPGGVYEVDPSDTSMLRINTYASYVKKMVGNIQYQ